MMFRHLGMPLIGIIFLLSSCKESTSPPEVNKWTVNTSLIEEVLTKVSEPILMDNLRYLTSYPGRDENWSETMDDTRQWLAGYFDSLGLAVELHQYIPGVIKTIYFKNEQEGWIINDFGRFHTTDGGDSWINESRRRATSFCFYDQQYGFLTDGNFRATTDGGLSWSSRNSASSARLADRLYFKSPTEGLAFALGTLYGTMDGGYIWTPVATPELFVDLFILNDTLMWGRYGDHTSFRTTDGWKTYENLAEIAADDWLEHFIFLSPDRGTAQLAGGTDLYLTKDGGGTWTVSPGWPRKEVLEFIQLPEGGLFAMDEPDGSVASIYFSADSGSTWEQRGTYYRQPYAGFFLNNLYGWVGTSDGYFKSTDGGYTWREQNHGFSLQDTRENIIITIPGSIEPQTEILLTAHYDTYYITAGADDNGSGVVALMEFARILSRYDLAYTVTIVLFTDEEDHKQGSYRLAYKMKKEGRNIKAVLNFDAIGYWQESLPRDLNIIYRDQSEWLADQVIDITQSFTDIQIIKNKHFGGYGSDDNNFSGQGYAAVWFFEAGNENEMSPYMHTENDVIENMNMPFWIDNIKAGLACAAYISGIQNLKE